VISTITGDLSDAEKNLKRCLAINPDYAKAYKNLGILYDTKMKKSADAVSNYNKYLSLRPDCPERGLVKLWIAALGG
ncbi:tetratricopeptide repeat protein, partial [Candidatus Nomurabacteria bacterium]|nr:tetratricopeptide repeat protein [Candidatus Nomurabacteria bacterium]